MIVSATKLDSPRSGSLIVSTPTVSSRVSVSGSTSSVTAPVSIPVMIGGSSVLATVMVKILVAVLVVSSAVTLTLKEPTSLFTGVPLKVLVTGLKMSHAGRAES